MEIINDRFNFKDSVNSNMKGLLYFYDKDGNLIYQTHNMIVSGARKLLLNLFVNNLSANPSTTGLSSSVSNIHLYYNLSYLDTPVITTESTVLSDIKTTSSAIYTEEFIANDMTINATDLYISFSLSVKALQDTTNNYIFQKYNQLYLTYKIGDSGTETLFSRVVLDPHYVTGSDVANITYKIYF